MLLWELAIHLPWMNKLVRHLPHRQLKPQQSAQCSGRGPPQTLWSQWQMYFLLCLTNPPLPAIFNHPISSSACGLGSTISSRLCPAHPFLRCVGVCGGLNVSRGRSTSIHDVYCAKLLHCLGEVTYFLPHWDSAPVKCRFQILPTIKAYKRMLLQCCAGAN